MGSAFPTSTETFIPLKWAYALNEDKFYAFLGWVFFLEADGTHFFKEFIINTQINVLQN